MLAMRSGRRRNGLSAGVAPPTTMWLPPPVPMAAVEAELLGAEAGSARLLVNGGGDSHGLVPGGGRVHVNLDYAGVGRDLDHPEAGVERRG